jgi:hypothetical protein
MPVTRTTTANQQPTCRSRVSNGRDLVAGADGRSAQARRYRDLMAEMTSDLGGADLLSEAQRQLIRRAAGLAVQAEAVEAAIIAGKDIDLGSYVTATNALRRVLDTIGLKRVAKDTPDLARYLAARSVEVAAE